jgi:glycosyltransferase involved in cell wall biosynthesis
VRLLYVLTHLAYGGAETQVVELARRFAGRGRTVEVLSLMPVDGLTDRLDEAGVSWSSLGVPRGVWSPRLVSGVVAAYRRFRPDVVHSHTLPANFAARAARAIQGVPVLITSCHNLTEGGAARMAFYRVSDRLADVTTNCSVSAVERYVRIGAVPAGRIRYVPNGIDTERFRPDAALRERVRASLGVGDAFVWLAVGRMTEQKDWPTMIEAARSLPAGDQLLVVGDGELADDVRARVQTLGERGRWLGVRADVDDLMKAADGFVSSSAWEGLPVVLLEAAASGLPIAATRVGGNDQVVLDGESGVLVPAADPGALADAMTRVRGDGSGMGLRGRAHVEASFGMDAVVAQWDALYAEFLRGANTSSVRSSPSSNDSIGT